MRGTRVLQGVLYGFYLFAHSLPLSQWAGPVRHSGSDAIRMPVSRSLLRETYTGEPPTALRCLLMRSSLSFCRRREGLSHEGFRVPAVQPTRC